MPDDTGNTIAQDIAAVGDVITPIVKDLDPVIGKGVEIAFKVVAAAEPAVYNAIKAILQGTPLTPDQVKAMSDIEARLQDPEQYFA